VGKRRLWLVLAEIVAISAPLTWLWVEGGRRAYNRLLGAVAGPLFAWLGLPSMKLGLVSPHFVSWLPFLVLVAVTPGLALRRRALGTLLGLATIFLVHVACALLGAISHAAYGESARAVALRFPLLMFNDALPFILWALLARDFVRDFASRALGRDPSLRAGRRIPPP
jgi:hypothetical protein